MNAVVRSSDSSKSSKETLPPVGEPVVVQCERFRCLAFRDRDGKWKDWFDKGEITGSVQVIRWE